MTGPRIAIGPGRAAFAEQAVRAGGGIAVPADEPADGLVWLAPRDRAGLAGALSATGARWVQLSSAGIERMAAAGLIDPARTWTCAKGTYSEPVAEHALMLALTGLRRMRQRIAAHTWGSRAADTLFDQPVTILGGGGVASSLIDLLAPFRARVTVVRRTSAPVPGSIATTSTGHLMDALAGAKVVFLALALTPATERIVGAIQLAAMRPDAWLVNVARGGHVDTQALVAALDAAAIAGAALDVTDPEPLPDGHPLWAHERCVITPHTADTREMTRRLLSGLICDNVIRFAAGRPLAGLVDPAEGY